MLKCPTGTYLFPLRTSLTFLTAFGFYSHSERFPLKTCGPVGFGLSLSKTVKIILLFCVFLTFLSISRRTPFPFRVSFPFFFFLGHAFLPTLQLWLELHRACVAPGSGPGVCVLLYLCDSLRNDSNWEKTWIKKKTTAWTLWILKSWGISWRRS